MDFNSAYLNAALSENIYMRPPLGFPLGLPDSKILKLQKTLYSLKQSGREWYLLLSSTLATKGWKQSKANQCLFIRNIHKNHFQVLLVYVDDIILGCPDIASMDSLKAEISSLFEAKNLGVINYLLGIHIKRHINSQQVYIDQAQLIKKVIDKHCTNSSSRTSLPVKLGTNETILISLEREEITQHQQIIGSLLYLSRYSRPDIAFAVNCLSRTQANPTSVDALAAQTVLNYLNATIDLKLHLNYKSDLSIDAFSNADWGSNKIDRNSTTGCCIVLGKAIVNWISKKQKSVALSTMEAEYVAASITAKEILFIENLLAEFNINCTPKLNCDNLAAISIMKDPKEPQRVKHIDLSYHFVRELVNNNHLKLEYVNSRNNPADVFTKPLNKNQFNNYCQFIGIIKHPQD